jgi:DNA-binding NarL/FixJ family response regulator
VTKTIVACVEDLFFRSKIEATARHLNVPLRFADAESLGETAADPKTAGIILDLSANGEPLAAVRKLRSANKHDLPIVGFLSHVDRELARQAEAAGVTHVLPRSQFSENLPDLMMDLVAPGTKRDVQEEPELPDE